MSTAQSAVSNVTPKKGTTNTGPSPSVGTPTAIKTGRKPILLKGGKPYAEARDEAIAAVRAAKAQLKTDQAALKTANKAIADVVKTREATVKQFGKVKPTTDAKVEKQRAKDNGAALKHIDGLIKAATKARDAQNKVVAKSEATLAKAEANAAKVEEAKAAALAPKA